MSPNEADKIIAEFMGGMVSIDHISYFTGKIEDGFEYHDLFSESLDALVPVWDRMGMSFQIYYLMGTHKIVTPYGEFLYNSMDIQQAAAIATAKAIKGLDV